MSHLGSPKGSISDPFTDRRTDVITVIIRYHLLSAVCMPGTMPDA